MKLFLLFQEVTSSNDLSEFLKQSDKYPITFGYIVQSQNACAEFPFLRTRFYLLLITSLVSMEPEQGHYQEDSIPIGGLCLVLHLDSPSRLQKKSIIQVEFEKLRKHCWKTTAEAGEALSTGRVQAEGRSCLLSPPPVQCAAPVELCGRCVAQTVVTVLTLGNSASGSIAWSKVVRAAK